MRRAEDFFKYLIDTGPAVIFRRTVDDLATYISPNVERILGYTQDEVVGGPGFWPERVHPDDRERFLAEAREAFARADPEITRDYRFQHKDGSYRWMHARTLLEYDETGAPEALLGYAIDMTEQRAAEEQNARLWGFPLALIFVAGLDGYFKRVSAGYERLLGWTERELLSRPFFELVHPDDIAPLGAALQDVVAGRTEVINQEIRALCKDGTYRWLMGNYRPVLDEGLMYGMAVDITERKRSEDALRDNERRTRLILDTAHEAFVAMDIDGVIRDWNVEAERVFGWSRREAIGRPLVETIIPERHRPAHVQGLERYRATGEGPLLGRRVEIEGLRADGSELPVELTISPTQSDDTVVFNAFLRDITERKQAEEELRSAMGLAERAKHDAEVANRAKSEFLSRMSHELRTPLNAILGFGQLLDMDPLPAPQRDSVEQILKAGGHLLELINEVLDIARIEEGKLSISVEPVRVRDPLGEALDLVRPIAAQRNVKIDVVDAAMCDHHVLADRQRLKQVLLNLLANGIKYNREGGAVEVSCTRMGERLRVSLADTGPGIAPEEMERLFVPFERLGAEGGGVEGTGIGLALSKRLVELMGGDIGAESRIGEGSTFWIELAITNDQAEGHVGAGAAAHREPVRTRAVLYVEDNLSNMKLVERIMTRRPEVRLFAAMQGRLGVELAREHVPDLILLDVHLPDMRGEQVLERLREDPATAEIPVVVISAEATTAKIERFLAAGARAYLTKPLDVARFLELIDQILGEEVEPS